jgi:hypothetical protein
MSVSSHALSADFPVPLLLPSPRGGEGRGEGQDLGERLGDIIGYI